MHEMDTHDLGGVSKKSRRRARSRLDYFKKMFKLATVVLSFECPVLLFSRPIFFIVTALDVSHIINSIYFALDVSWIKVVCFLVNLATK